MVESYVPTTKYDFGFWPECEYDVRLATGNKFSTFIEAGIPFFYFKRNLLLNKILINNRYKILPSSIG